MADPTPAQRLAAALDRLERAARGGRSGPEAAALAAAVERALVRLDRLLA